MNYYENYGKNYYKNYGKNYCEKLRGTTMKQTIGDFMRVMNYLVDELGVNMEDFTELDLSGKSDMEFYGSCNPEKYNKYVNIFSGLKEILGKRVSCEVHMDMYNSIERVDALRWLRININFSPSIV